MEMFEECWHYFFLKCLADISSELDSIIDRIQPQGNWKSCSRKFTCLYEKATERWVWWYTPIIPTLGKLRLEEHKLDVSLGYIMYFSLKRKKGI
jgi:hypothetical protein